MAQIIRQAGKYAPVSSQKVLNYSGLRYGTPSPSESEPEPEPEPEPGRLTDQRPHPLLS